MNSGRTPGRATILVLTLGGFLTTIALGGCSGETRYKTLSLFLDGVKKDPPPPTRRVRPDLLREIEELKRKLAAAEAMAKAAKDVKPAEELHHPAEKAKTWDEAVKALPRNPAGRADWIQAIKAGAIAPRPGRDPKAAEQAVLDLDVEMATSASKLFSVTYPHRAHTQWLSCANCHPSIFPLKRGAERTVVTMAEIRAGQFCGVCHGKVTFGVERECARCHTKIPDKTDWRAGEASRKPVERAVSWNEAAKLLPVTAGATDWAKALAEGVIAPRSGVAADAADEPVFPITVERVPADQAIFKAVFPHEAHTALLKCDSCHPAPFEMQGGATPINMGLIQAGQACGVCHGRVAFPPTACGRCHPAMAPK